MAKFTLDTQPSLRLLTNGQIEIIHEKALYILANTGVKYDSEQALTILANQGAEVDFARKVARIPPALVLRALETVPGTIQLYDREGEPAVLLGGNKVHFAPGSAPLNVLESDGFTVRPARAKDLVQIAIINDSLKNIALQSTSVVLSDVPKPIGDCYRLYLLLKYSGKPVITGAFSVAGISYMRDMLASLRGGDAELRQKPLAVFDICPSPPLKWTYISAQNIIDCAAHGLPLETVSVPMPGAASPVTLAGSVLLHTVESLSGIVLAQCVNPGAPVVYGGAPMYFDMRHSTTSLNSVETAMLSGACAQMGKYYGLPTHTYGGLSDAKVIDAQTGLESGMSALSASLAGINVISGAGAMEFCGTFSLEKLVIDNEICGMALRMERGIEFSEESLAVDLIAQLGPGGDYLSTEHTFKWFKREPYLPSPVIDRLNRENWAEKGSAGAFRHAREQVDLLLENHPAQAPEDRQKELDQVMRRILQKTAVKDVPYGPE